MWTANEVTFLKNDQMSAYTWNIEWEFFFHFAAHAESFECICCFGNRTELHIVIFEKQENNLYVTCDQREYLKTQECASVDPLHFLSFLIDVAYTSQPSEFHIW